MFVLNTLKHNSFKEVDVPSPSTLYKRLGFGQGTQKASGEEFLDPSANKIDQAQEVQKEIDKQDKED